MSRVLVVTPTYNESDNLERFVQSVHEALPEAHVLVVDDASPDGTGKIADRLAGQDERVRVLHRGGKLGIGSAYVEGFRYGLRHPEYEVIVQMDTDHSHDPKYLPALLRAIDDGADVAVGSRNVPGGGVEGWGVGRHVLSKGGSLYARTILGAPIRDFTAGYKAWRRDTLATLGLSEIRSEGYSFQIEMTWRALAKNAVVREVPIVFVDRRAGESKMSRKIFLEAVLMVWKLRLESVAGR